MRAWLRPAIVLVVAGLLLSLFLLRQQRQHFVAHPLVSHPEKPAPSTTSVAAHRKPVALVVTSQTNDDTSWLKGKFQEWEHIIYVTNDRKAKNTVEKNKGRENMVYLSYIIDNYDNLPEITIFQHANRYQWHNDDPLYDGQRMLERLQIPYIRQQGYVNLRCVWTLGCPVEIRPLEEENETKPTDNDARAGSFFKQAFEELFPDLEVPARVGVSCCNQFAATAEKIRERPKSDYVRYRNWILNTTLNDDLSGRILEYSWHIIFNQGPVFCPSAPDCYCKLFGLCNLVCESEEVCASQYTLPVYSTMPNGWPDYDRNGDWRNVTEIRKVQELDYAPMRAGKFT